MPDVAAHSTGTVVRIERKPGDAVAAGDPVVILESMKMENPILAPVSGKVTEIKVSAAQVVKPGETIATIEY